MRRDLIILFLTTALMFQSSIPLHAQIFGFGFPFATEFTQLLNHAQLISEYIRQGQQLEEELKQTADLIANSKMITTQVFGPIVRDINALAEVVQGGQALAYSLANLDGEFRNRFRGYAYNARTY